ncbi:MAG TPA: hypothetical protein GXX18_18760 [Bacillales bacterium]|nr:hypothetical protein [Bacillales bacterium]
MNKVSVFTGAFLILWGISILYSSLFKMKKEDYKDKGVFGVSGYIELEFLFSLLHKLPLGVIKGLIVLIGISFIGLGIIVLYLKYS